MTTYNAAAKPPESQIPFTMPDPDPRPEDMTGFDHLAANGDAYHLRMHFGNPETTLVTGEHYLSAVRTSNLTGIRYPDLLIAFNVDTAEHHRANAYINADQGKPPDFVMEIASAKTGRTDWREKRDDYAALGLPEYWRFDETGQFHRTRLAGDRLVDGRYRPIPIEELADGILQGFSEVLNLYLRWDHGQLRWHDPATGQPIATLHDERARTEEAEARADSAEARARDLEQELRRLRGAN